MTWADESQKNHEELIEFSKKIDSLKEIEKVKLDEFLKEKVNFSQVNAKLKEKLQKLGEVQGNIQEINKKRVEEKKKGAGTY